MSEDSKNRLPAPFAPMPEDVTRAAEMAAFLGEQYRYCAEKDMGIIPHVIRVHTGTGKGLEVYGFPEFTREIKASCSRMIQALLPHSKAIVFLHEAWVTTNSKELLEGSGVVMPPRVDPRHRDAVVITILMNGGRRVSYSNFVVGEGDGKHLEGWQLQGDTANPDSKFVRQNFEPAQPVPLQFVQVNLEGGKA